MLGAEAKTACSVTMCADTPEVIVLNNSIKAKSSQGFSEAGDGAELNDLWLPCSDDRPLVLSETFLPCNLLLRPPGLDGFLDMEAD